MTASFFSPIRPATWIVLLALGCSLNESTPTSDSSLPPGELESPIHDIRLAEWNLWSGMPTPVEVFLPVDDRDGWTYEWCAGGDQLDGAGREVVWTTPLADSAWIESTLRRGDSEYICRRWFALRNDSLTLRLELAPMGVQVGAVEVEARFNRPLPDTARCVWGEDPGAHLSGTSTRCLWEVSARGSHRVWAAVELAGRVVADTLEIEIPNYTPQLGPGFGDNWGPYPYGSVFEDWIRVDDLNEDVLRLELLELDGLELLDSTWRSNDTWDYQGSWHLLLRDTGTEPSQRTLQFRVGDGELWCPGTLVYQFE